MKAYHSYEDIAWANAAPPAACVLEGWSPPSIARWYVMITYQLQNLINKAEADRTPEYQERLEKFFKHVWKTNIIDENVNVEAIENNLKEATKLALADWPQASYFKGLTASLTELRAWQTTKGTVPPEGQNTDMIGGGAGGSMPPLNPDYGPEENPPGEGEEKPPGEGEEPGAPVTPEPPPGLKKEKPNEITV